MKQVTLEGFLKKKKKKKKKKTHTHKDVSETITAAKMELFVVLVSSFQLLINFTKNPNIGSRGDLNTFLVYYNAYRKN